MGKNHPFQPLILDLVPGGCQTATIMIGLHHFFILTARGAPQADLLSDIGMIEGAGNHHPGQGTANRRFFFSNTVLELLYIRDATEATTGRGRRLRIADRATDNNASPFGLIVTATDVPFHGWQYCPEYFPADQCFHVGDNSDLLTEPLCIWMPRNLPLLNTHPQPENSDLALTELRISVPVVRPSSPLQAIADCQAISLRPNSPHQLELVFNEEEQGCLKDMTPDLPLVVRW